MNSRRCGWTEVTQKISVRYYPDTTLIFLHVFPSTYLWPGQKLCHEEYKALAWFWPYIKLGSTLPAFAIFIINTTMSKTESIKLKITRSSICRHIPTVEGVNLTYVPIKGIGFLTFPYQESRDQYDQRAYLKAHVTPPKSLTCALFVGMQQQRTSMT
jgi:hypothetical protein